MEDTNILNSVSEESSADTNASDSDGNKNILSHEAKIEALIFASPKPIKVSELTDLLGGELTQPEVQEVVSRLVAYYKARSGGFRIEHLGTMGYQFQSVEKAGYLMERLFASRPRPISRAGLETLAIIAYRQPVTRAEVEYVRGVDVGGILKALMDKGLVECVGRRPDAGRPMMFGTTDEFLKVFKLTSIKDLPPLESFQASPDILKEANQDLSIEQEPVEVDNFISDPDAPLPLVSEGDLTSEITEHTLTNERSIEGATVISEHDIENVAVEASESEIDDTSTTAKFDEEEVASEEVKED